MARRFPSRRLRRNRILPFVCSTREQMHVVGLCFILKENFSAPDKVYDFFPPEKWYDINNSTVQYSIFLLLQISLTLS